MIEKKRDLIRLFFKMNILMHRYQSHVFKIYGPFGNPHRGQGRILSLLKMKPEISQKELSFLLDMRSQSLGELLAKLEHNGLITRTPSETDRRVMDIKLTEKGEDAAEKSKRQSFDDIKLFDCLTIEEQENLGEYLRRIIKELQKRLGEENINGHDFDPPWFREGFKPPFADEMFKNICRNFNGEEFDEESEDSDDEHQH